jgi:MFS transporter, FLVCR family, MFS-domain-containing protein 7
MKNKLLLGAFLTILGAWLKFVGAKAPASRYSILMLGQITAALGQPFFLNVPTFYSDKWFTASSRVTANAIMSLSNAVGAAIGQIVNPAIASTPGDIPNMVFFLIFLNLER